MSARHFTRSFRVLVPVLISLSMGGCPFLRTQQAAAPIFDPAGGTFTGSVSVTMSTATDNATIYYTTDGTTPDESNGTAYSDMVVLTQTTNLKAIAYKGNMKPSEVTSSTFTIDSGASRGVPPLVSDAAATGYLYAGESRPIHLSATATDADGQVVSVTVDLSAVGGAKAQALVKGKNDVWAWSGDVTAAAAGSKAITFTATDNLGDAGSAIVSMDVGETRPAVGTLIGTFAANSAVNASPAVGPDGTIYAVTFYAGVLYAINPDGSQKWSLKFSDSVWRSPSVASDGTVYIGCHDQKLYAINPDGTQKWLFPAADYLDSAPAIGTDGTLYVGARDDYLRAINPDGTEKWAFQGGNDFYAEAAVGAEGTIYAGCWDHKLYALNPDGTEKWEYATGDIIQAGSAIGSDGTIYTGSDDGNLYALDPAGTLKWSFTTGAAIRGAPSIAPDGTIYIGSTDHNLYAINPDGSQKWLFSTGDEVWATPAVGSDGMIYFGSDDNVLYALNADGTESWRFTGAADALDSSPVIMPDGTLYVGSWDGNVYVFHVTGEMAVSPWPMFQRNPTHAGNVKIP